MASKREQQRRVILSKLEQYKDVFGNVDISTFRHENLKMYRRIPYYFGSIDEALSECSKENELTQNGQEEKEQSSRKTEKQLNEIVFKDSTEQSSAKPADQVSKKGTGAPVNRLTLRNELAYDMLKSLREKYTLQEIADYYGVSRAYVNQLWQALVKSVGPDIKNVIDVKKDDVK